MRRAAAILAKAAEEGIHCLVTLQDKATPPHVRCAAACNTIDRCLHLRQVVELEKRLVALENGVAAPNGSSLPAGPSAPRPSGQRRRRGDVTVQTALAGGDSVAQAASKAGLSERTVYRRLQEPTFKRCIEDLRHQMLERAAALLITATLLATKTLIDLVQDSTVSAAVRRRAGCAVLELSQKLREVTVLERRLVALENEQSTDAACQRAA